MKFFLKVIVPRYSRTLLLLTPTCRVSPLAAGGMMTVSAFVMAIRWLSLAMAAEGAPYRRRLTRKAIAITPPAIVDVVDTAGPSVVAARRSTQCTYISLVTGRRRLVIEFRTARRRRRPCQSHDDMVLISRKARPYRGAGGVMSQKFRARPSFLLIDARLPPTWIFGRA